MHSNADDMRRHLETDQTACYAQDGRIIPCEDTRQDASMAETGRRLPGRRFRPHMQVVKDAFTGAVWTRDANPARFPQTWHEALATVADMRGRRAFGYGGWQLPSRGLLFSLISHQYINPAITADHPFENIFNGYYWTQDSCCRLPDQAWYVHLGGGRIHRGMKHGSYLVWPVCPGAAGTPPFGGAAPDRFEAAADGVYDRHTGLIWSTDADPLGRQRDWQAALSAVRRFDGGPSDRPQGWRLPNIRELESLVDLDAHTPALPAGHPFVNVQEGYWSSTTSVYEPRYAWVLYSRDGAVGVGFKPGAAFHAWPVRRP
ncbi:MAG TPA: DUF1566 domain-containing protein [Desulfosarcina sp.]|nr:DUF1566 domain-containing protein [Desulfosarcina sp.]